MISIFEAYLNGCRCKKCKKSIKKLIDVIFSSKPWINPTHKGE